MYWSPSLFFFPYLTHSPDMIQYSSVVQHIAVTLSANKTKQRERRGGRKKIPQMKQTNKQKTTKNNNSNNKKTITDSKVNHEQLLKVSYTSGSRPRLKLP